MANPALFGHDRLAHLLSDRLLSVPRFQRGYAWDATNIQEFLDDLKAAREGDQSYFMGTIVLADDPNEPGRQIVVDGQQRLTTTAILVAAIAQRLQQMGEIKAANEIDKVYLKTFDLEEKTIVTRLKLNIDDLAAYEDILLDNASPARKGALWECYNSCAEYLSRIPSSEDGYRQLISIINQLEGDVQVLLAVASGLSEAYVIFETLNDRGADLTTADLLKNYLFSQAGDYLHPVEQQWTKVGASFDKPDDLVKFIRYEYSSRAGKVTTRKLYKALQSDIGRGQRRVRNYVNRLEDSLRYYSALRDPDNEFWGQTNVDVRDALLAFRRFGFESSTPLMLAALNSWELTNAAKLINKIAGWSVRAWFAGRLGGGTAEQVFCDAAVAVSSGDISSQPSVLASISKIIPDDKEFARAFAGFGSISTSRAKYLLAQLERQYCITKGYAGGGDAQPDWSGKTVSVEHILPESSKRGHFSSDAEFDRFTALVNSIGNFTLLERT